MKAPLVGLLGLNLSGVPRRERLAALMILACELEYLKHSLCYAGMGSWQAFRDDVKAGTRPTWEDFCKTNAGVTETTQRHYFGIWQALRGRVAEGGNESARALMEERPSNLTAKEREDLVGLIAGNLGENDTFTTLKRRLLRTAPESADVPTPKSPSPVDVVFQAEHLRKMALRIGLEPSVAEGVVRRLLVREWQATKNPRNLIRLIHLRNDSAAAGTEPKTPGK